MYLHCEVNIIYSLMMENNFISMLQEVFQELNGFIADYNSKVYSEGGQRIPKQAVKIVGQGALLCADLPFPITATMDLDTVTELPDIVARKLDMLLSKEGLRLESDSHLIWMPDTTKYTLLFDFDCVQIFIADPQSVILSKYKFNRFKDWKLIESYRHYFPEVDLTIKKITNKNP